MPLKQIWQELNPTRNRNLIAFIFSFLVATLLTMLLSDASFTKIQSYVLFLLFFTIGLWVTEAIPPFSVSILIVGFLVLIMGRSEAHDAIQYLQTWSDSVIWLFLGGFFLAEAMKKTKLDLMLLKAVLPKFGNRPAYVLWGLMLVTALMSMLMSNTATTAMMIATISPLFVSLDKSSKLSRALLLGIPAAASVGGMGTIIGSAPNAIAVGALEKLGHPISFLEWMMVGTPLAFVLLFIFWRVLIIKYKVNQEQPLDFGFLMEVQKDENPDPKEHTHKLIVLVILAVTLFCWLTSKWIGIPVAAASGIPIVGLTMMGILDAKDIRQLPWDTLMLVAGGLALGLAIEEQRIAAHFVEQLSHIQVSFIMLLVIFGFITVVLSNFMSNTAATTILIPMGVSLLTMVGGGDVNPLVLPLVIGLSASCALFLPVSTPPNAIAFSTGLIQQSEFRLGGVVIGILGPVLSIAWVLVLYMLF